MNFTRGGSRYTVNDLGHVIDEDGSRVVLTEEDLKRVAEESKLPLDVLNERWKNGDTYEELVRPVAWSHLEQPSEQWITLKTAATLIGCSYQGLRNLLRMPEYRNLLRLRSRGRGAANRVGFLCFAPDVHALGRMFVAFGCRNCRGKVIGLWHAAHALKVYREGKLDWLLKDAA